MSGITHSWHRQSLVERPSLKQALEALWNTWTSLVVLHSSVCPSEPNSVSYVSSWLKKVTNVCQKQSQDFDNFGLASLRKLTSLTLGGCWKRFGWVVSTWQYPENDTFGLRRRGRIIQHSWCQWVIMREGSWTLKKELGTWCCKISSELGFFSGF